MIIDTTKKNRPSSLAQSTLKNIANMTMKYDDEYTDSSSSLAQSTIKNKGRGVLGMEESLLRSWRKVCSQSQCRQSRRRRKDTQKTHKCIGGFGDMIACASKRLLTSRSRSHSASDYRRLVNEYTIRAYRYAYHGTRLYLCFRYDVL